LGREIVKTKGGRGGRGGMEIVEIGRALSTRALSLSLSLSLPLSLFSGGGDVRRFSGGVVALAS